MCLNSTFINNIGYYGNCIHNNNLNINHSIFMDNKSNSIQNSYSYMNITNCTFSNNNYSSVICQYIVF